MIKKIELTRFKKYTNHAFELHPQGLTLLVGGNNAGKSTLIQALAVWEFCKMILLHEKGRSFLNKAAIGKTFMDLMDLAIGKPCLKATMIAD